MKKARGATQRGEPISSGDASHNGETKGLPHEMTSSLTWSLVIGERALVPERISDEGETGEGGKSIGVGRKLSARCSTTLPADLTRGNLEREGLPMTVTCVHVPVTVHKSGQCRISYV